MKGSWGAWEWNWKMRPANEFRALRPKGRRVLELGVTPLIDIIFLLLIFFMLTSSFITHEGIRVELPITQSPHALPAAKVLEITVQKDGGLLFMGKPISLSGLEAWLVEQDSDLAPQVFEIRSDRKAAVQTVVSLLELLGKHGASRVSLGTVSSGENEGP